MLMVMDFPSQFYFHPESAIPVVPLIVIAILFQYNNIYWSMELQQTSFFMLSIAVTSNLDHALVAIKGSIQLKKCWS